MSVGWKKRVLSRPGIDAEGRRRRAGQPRQVGEGHAPLGAPAIARSARRTARARPPRTPRARAASRRALSRTSRAARATALPPTTAARLANVPVPVLDARGVARDDGDVLGRDAQLVGGDLGQRRLEPLALRGHAAPRGDAPRRVRPARARSRRGRRRSAPRSRRRRRRPGGPRRARRRPRRTAPRSRAALERAAQDGRQVAAVVGPRGRCRGSSAAPCRTACPRRAPGSRGARAARSRPVSRATRSSTRSITKTACGWPAPRYGVTGTRLV